ncbi:MAG: GIY-YIG nuclease family protein [Candidatus Pacebacteria bacterium]|nr:GIY-YIG nuclease family protein [Candidatus Paceibacterota bacterium]
MFHVYAIHNIDLDKIYIGHTSDLENRIKRHNGLLKNKSKSYTSKNKGEWKLIYSEEFLRREDATKRERQLKSYRGREFVKTKI